jgi:uncharacterized protein HemX
LHTAAIADRASRCARRRNAESSVGLGNFSSAETNHGVVRFSLVTKLGDRPMRLTAAVIAAALATSLAACGESQADKAAEAKADAMESQAAATSNETAETNLNAKADAIEQQAGNVDGGMTTENTPNTSPSTPQTPAH